MLAIYEPTDVRILLEVFIQACERSAQRHTVIRGAVGDPDSFRMKYREAITGQVAGIIRARCGEPENQLMGRLALEGFSGYAFAHAVLG